MVVLYGQFMMHGQRNIKLPKDMFLMSIKSSQSPNWLLLILERSKITLLLVQEGFEPHVLG